MVNHNTKHSVIETLPRRVFAVCKARGLEDLLLHEPLVIGVSGGADSFTLLHILLALRTGEALQSIHVGHLDHRFRGGESVADMEFVKELCAEWGVGFTAAAFDVPSYAAAHGLSAEEAARGARYTFLEGLASERGASLAVAHTADDQVETVLMNIIRGTGISGLGGMRWISTIPPAPRDSELNSLAGNQATASTKLFRPLLGVWREEVDEYCRAISLKPRVDASNLDLAYRRNKVRHELIPLLATHYNRSVKQHLWTLADLAADEDDAVEKVVDRLWPSLVSQDSLPGSVHIDLAALSSQPEAIRRRVARRAISEAAGTLVGFEHDHIAALATMFKLDSPAPWSVDLPSGIAAVRSGQVVCVGPRGNCAHLESTNGSQFWPVIDFQAFYDVVPGQNIALAHGWRLRVIVEESTGMSPTGDNLSAHFDLTTLGDPSRLVIRTRRSGDRISPFGLPGSKTLQDLFVDAKIPVHYRRSIPLLAFRDSSEVLWVPGRGGRRSSHAPISDMTKSVIRFQFERMIK